MTKKEYQYGYPAVIWNDEDDNCVLNENHELIIRFNEFGGKVTFYNCDDDQDAIAKAQATAQALKGLQSTFETYKILKNATQIKDKSGNSEISEKASKQFTPDQGQ